MFQRVKLPIKGLQRRGMAGWLKKNINVEEYAGQRVRNVNKFSQLVQHLFIFSLIHFPLVRRKYHTSKKNKISS